MSRSVTAETLFGDYASFYLPAYLNKHHLTVKQFGDLSIARHPDLIKGLMLSTIASRFPEAKKKMRNEFSRNPVPVFPEKVGRWLNAFDSAGSKSWEQKMLRETKRLIEDNGLYDTPEGVKAKLAGYFSYDPGASSYEFDLEMHTKLECPACHADETVYDGGEVELKLLCDNAEYFTHVAGPYARCHQCDAIVRPTIEAADQLPNDYRSDFDGREEWDQYTDHLNELLTQLKTHAESQGLGTPSKLHVGANNLDWRGRSGYKVIDVEASTLADTMRVDSDFIITNGKLWLNPDGTGELTCGMAHHDASGSICVTPLWQCELDDSNRWGNDTDDRFISGEELPRAKALAEVATLLLCGEGRSDGFFNYSPKTTFKYVSPKALAEELEHACRNLPDQLDDGALAAPENAAPTLAGVLLQRSYARLIRHILHRHDAMETLVLEARELRQWVDAYIAL